MFVKRARARGFTYLQLAESYWEDGRARQRVIKSLGREDQLDPRAIDRLVDGLRPYGSVAGPLGQPLGNVQLLGSHPEGLKRALDAAWMQAGLDDLLVPLFSRSPLSKHLEQAVRDLVFRELTEPGHRRGPGPLLGSLAAWSDDPDDGVRALVAALGKLAGADVSFRQHWAHRLSQLRLLEPHSRLLLHPFIVQPQPQSRSSRSLPKQHIAILATADGIPVTHWWRSGPDALRWLIEAANEFTEAVGAPPPVHVLDDETGEPYAEHLFGHVRNAWLHIGQPEGRDEQAGEHGGRFQSWSHGTPVRLVETGLTRHARSFSLASEAEEPHQRPGKRDSWFQGARHWEVHGTASLSTDAVVGVVSTHLHLADKIGDQFAPLPYTLTMRGERRVRQGALTCSFVAQAIRCLIDRKLDAVSPGLNVADAVAKIRTLQRMDLLVDHEKRTVYTAATAEQTAVLKAIGARWPTASDDQRSGGSA